MSDIADAPTQDEGDHELKRDKPTDAKPYLRMVEQADTAFEPYQAACDNIDKHYANLERLRSNTRDRGFQIFWANLQTLKTAIYARAPVPVVGARHKIRKALPRTASEFLERCLITNADMEKNHRAYKQVRDDLALHARGVPWITYKVRGGDYEYACTEHLNRKDFLHEPARKWKEVDWVARRVWLSAKQGKKRFKKKWRNVTYTSKDNDTSDDYKVRKKVPVWEMWIKSENKVVWISPNVEHVLDEKDFYLDLEEGFPCPEPAYGTCEPDTLIPVPDFLFYKDQLEEINDLTARIAALCQALRLKGFYPAGAEDVSSAIERAVRSNSDRALLVPIPDLSGLMTNGSRDPIVWMPVDMVADVLRELLMQRKQLIEDVYEITGISDIMRGVTQASETLGAQQLKSQYGNVRVRDRQEEMVRVCRDCIAIEGEIMAEEFHPANLRMMAQMDLPTDEDIAQQMQGLQEQGAKLQQQMQMMQSQPPQPPQQPAPGGEPQPDPAAAMEQQMQAMQGQLQALQGQMQEVQETVTVDAVIKFLKAEKLRPFILDIESDSTIQADEDAEKQRRTEFVGALSTLLTQGQQLVAAEPQTAPFVGEVIKFSTAPFRVGRSLEGHIDDLVEMMEQKAEAAKNQPEPPNPDVIKAEAEAKAVTERAQARVAEIQAQSQATVEQIQAKAAADAERHEQAMEDMAARMVEQAEQAKEAKAQRDAEHARTMETKTVDLARANAQLAAAQEKPLMNGDAHGSGA